MEFHEKFSMDNIPWKFHGSFSVKFHVGKNTKTPWRLHGNPREILHIITMEYSYLLAHVELRRRFSTVLAILWSISRGFHGVYM